MTNEANRIRPIAFYLPQFYPTSENNEWWGKGFTEWTNVAKAKPLFKGHYQPHLPADLGFYDLRVPETRQAQADLAQQYGIYGFCYYHYWFHGRRMLERPFNEVLDSGKPDFPFCLCWANETWSRRWSGEHIEGEILMKQTYSDKDDRDHMRFLISAFQDPRYIKINGRPLFLIYRADYIEDRVSKMLEIWHEELDSIGLPDLYLCSMRTPPPPGFEASIDFFPGAGQFPEKTRIQESLEYRIYERLLKRIRHKIYDYTEIVDIMINRPAPEYKSFYCPVPNWDNSARRAQWGSVILKNSTPALFEKWLRFCVEKTAEKFSGDEQIIFINAWNEWAEGTHLEPDQKWNSNYLKAVKNALGDTGT